MTSAAINPFLHTEPIFDGSTIRLECVKDSVPPGTFVFYSCGNTTAEASVGRLICQPEPGVIKINIFRPPAFNDQLNTLRHPFAVGVSEIVQTSDICTTNSDCVLGFCFVFSEQDIIHGGVEVSGMLGH